MLQQTERHRTVEAHLPLARSIAVSIAKNLPPCYELDDLIQTGVLALYEALDSFDAARGCTFGSYARYRVRGAILDSLSASCAGDTPEEPDEEPAAAAGASIEESIAIRQSLALLPARERSVIELRYFGETRIRDIGEALRLSPRAVMRIRDRALGRMRSHLEPAAA